MHQPPWTWDRSLKEANNPFHTYPIQGNHSLHILQLICFNPDTLRQYSLYSVLIKGVFNSCSFVHFSIWWGQATEVSWFPHFRDVVSETWVSVHSPIGSHYWTYWLLAQTQVYSFNWCSTPVHWPLDPYCTPQTITSWEMFTRMPRAQYLLMVSVVIEKPKYSSPEH